MRGGRGATSTLERRRIWERDRLAASRPTLRTHVKSHPLQVAELCVSSGAKLLDTAVGLPDSVKSTPRGDRFALSCLGY